MENNKLKLDITFKQKTLKKIAKMEEELTKQYKEIKKLLPYFLGAGVQAPAQAQTQAFFTEFNQFKELTNELHNKIITLKQKLNSL